MMKTTSYLSQFNFQLSGLETGKKWVFLHGLMGYGSNWRKIVSGLSTSEYILTFDQRGHGRSWKPQTGYAPKDYAEDLYLITEELGWRDFILVGHSMGGRNALSFVTYYPEKVNKLIMEDIGPEVDLTAIEYYNELLASVPTPFKSKLEAKEYMLNEWPKKNLGPGNTMVLGQYLYSNLEEKENGTIDWRFSKEAIQLTVLQGRAKDSWNEFNKIPKPTLLIRGENSHILSKQEYSRVLASNPRIKGVEVLNAGHWVHSDQPLEFLRIIKDFVNQ